MTVPFSHAGSPGQSVYETDRALSEYLLLHFGSAADVLPYDFGPYASLAFPERCVSECVSLSRLPRNARALDVGCAVGGATFALTRCCEEAIGVDFSRQFIRAALDLKRSGHLGFDRFDEGRLHSRAIAHVPPDIDRARAHFEIGDAMHLHADLAGFDVVLSANLICRLPEPQLFLKRLPELVRRGGQLILTTPCSWLEEFTKHTRWLGGYENDEGEPVRTIDGLHAHLDENFELIRTLDMPFLIREHHRKYQWCVALATVWIRY
jgi:putative 4-mercaptohistidine N1-methyltranferase